jgi:hypothetical protein
MLYLTTFEAVMPFQDRETECCTGFPVTVAAGLIVKTTDALLLESVRLVAVILTRVVETTLGAVNKPDELNVPAVADHVTAVFRVSLTMAVNCRVFPETMVAFEGDPEMRTRPLPPEDELPLEGMLPPPQDESIKHASSKPKIVFQREVKSFFSSAAAKKTLQGAGGQVTWDIPNASVIVRSNLGRIHQMT